MSGDAYRDAFGRCAQLVDDAICAERVPDLASMRFQ
jgi:hypothetical protein